MQDMEEMMKAMGLPIGFSTARHNKATTPKNLEIKSKEPAAPTPLHPKTHLKESPKQIQDQEIESDEDFGPPLPPHVDTISDEENEVEEDDWQDTPITHHVTLKGHSKAVNAIGLDHSGSRLMTGGRDYTLKIWDFYKMDKRLLHLKSTIPVEGNHILDIQFGASGDQVLVATPEHCVRLFDRNGEEKKKFMTGDPYVRDQKRTLGHTSSITMVQWHPTDKKTFFTASADSTIRFWDVENSRKQSSVIPVKSKSTGQRTVITTATMSLDGRMILGAGEDGVLRCWPAKGPFVLPVLKLDNAHVPGNAITSACFYPCNQRFITRAMDSTLKLFDIRQFKKPIIEIANLENDYEKTNAILSPDGKYILTGTSCKYNKESQGQLLFFDSQNLTRVHAIDMGINTSCIRIQWHSRINQIFAGLSDGNIKCFYNPMTSVMGVKDALTREAKKKAVDDIDYHVTPVEVEVPEEEPMFPEEIEEQKLEYIKKKMENIIDPRDLRKPHMPGRGNEANTGGNLGTSVTSYMMKSIIKDRTMNDDPREAILRFAKEAEESPYWIAPAYKKTQPKSKFADSVYEDKDEERREQAKRQKRDK